MKSQSRSLSNVIGVSVAALAASFGLFGSLAHAQDNSKSLLWDAPADTDLASYRVYQDNTIMTSVPAGTTQITVASLNLAPGTYPNFTVTAVDLAGNESVKSNAIAIVIGSGGSPPNPNPGPGGGGGDGGNDGSLDPRTILDFTGDELTNIAFISKVGSHEIVMEEDLRTSTYDFEAGKGLPCHADYDGDGIAELCVAQKSGKQAAWKTKNLVSGEEKTTLFGSGRGFKLAGCHFNADDNKADMAELVKKTLRIQITGGSEILTPLPFNPRHKQLTCTDLNKDGVFEVAFYGTENSSSGRERFFVTAINLKGDVVFKARAHKNRKLIAVHGFNGDRSQGALALYRANRKSLEVFANGEGSAVKIQTPVITDCTQGDFASSDNSMSPGVLILDRSGTMHQLTFSDLAVKAGVPLPAGSKLIHAVNSGRK